jgi:FMN phosphatase YigB (HAD superfamily)
MKKIKAILFDLDGTLRLTTPSGGKVLVEYLQTHNITFSQEQILFGERWEHYYFANSPQIQQDTQTFKDDMDGFWLNYSKRRLMALELSESDAHELAPHVSKHMGEVYKPQVTVPEEIPSVLTALREEGYTLGVVSNRETSFQNELNEMNLTGYFDFLLAAGEVGAFKPDVKVFHHALQISKTRADETMYVGDNYFADIVGSNNAGLVPVLYDTTNLFPNAPDCYTIQSFEQLNDLLK